MKYALILSVVFAILIFSCTKDKAELVKAPEAVPVGYCDSMKTAGKVSFKCFVDSVMKIRCVSCHFSGGSGGTDFTTYSVINAHASHIAERISANPTTGSRMPDGGPYLSTDTIAKIQSWVTDGAKNN